MISEKKLEKLLIKLAAENGWLQRKVKWIGRNGAPDRVLMRETENGIPQIVWIELKTTGESPTVQQLKEHARMRAAGQLVLVIDNENRLRSFFA